MDDDELVKRAGKGDAYAFRQLLERHYDTAYRVAFRFTRHAEDAEDIAQDICLVLARKIGSFRGRSRFSTWLYRIVINACRDHVRRQKSTDTLQANYALFREQAMADAEHDKARHGWLGEAIAALEPKLKETAVLVLSEELSHGEAASALGCAESTVSWRMHEVRKSLKALVDEFDD
ncbi:MAG: RNA polymerase sigma factor [Hyphomicrobiaceae bacterium]|nr:RNA polymerase sigma factor [Hyphomicrobiaceae bacterium]